MSASGNKHSYLEGISRHGGIESNAWEPTVNSDIHALYSQKLFHLQQKVDVFDKTSGSSGRGSKIDDVLLHSLDHFEWFGAPSDK